MGQQSTKAGAVSSKDITVFDTDAHLMETDEQLIPYMDREVRHIMETNPGSGDKARSANVPFTYIGSKYESDPEDENGWGATVDVKLREMDDFGIDYGVVTPTMLLTHNTINNPEIGHEYAKAYNRFIEDEFLGEHERLFASVLVSRHKPAKCAEEIDRLADEEDIVAVSFGLGGMTPPLGSREYDPIYQAAADNGLPILLHGSGGASMWDLPMQYHYAHTYSEMHAVVNPFQAMWNMTTSLLRGLPERFPDIELVVTEAGISWIPYLVWRLDDVYLEFPDDSPALTQPPSQYVRDNYCFTTQPLGHTERPDDLATMVELAGPNSVMYSSDLPHPTFDTPNELYGRLDGRLDEQEIRNIMGETAMDLFGITASA